MEKNAKILKKIYKSFILDIILQWMLNMAPSIFLQNLIHGDMSKKNFSTYVTWYEKSSGHKLEKNILRHTGLFDTFLCPFLKTAFKNVQNSPQQYFEVDIPGNFQKWKYLFFTIFSKFRFPTSDPVSQLVLRILIIELFPMVDGCWFNLKYLVWQCTCSSPNFSLKDS